jgi:REP element-mobilizing transposase RayT
MARKLAVEYPGAVYHVITRADRGEPIFRDEDDRRRFLGTLGEACGKTDWQVDGLCLMPIHFLPSRDIFFWKSTGHLR